MALQEALDPTFREIGFIESSLESASSEHATWWRELGRDVRVKRCEGSLPALVRNLEPLTSVYRPRSLWVGSCSGEWTAYLDNGWKGPSVSGPMAVLARRLGVRALRVVSTPNAPRGNGHGTWESNILTIFGPDALGGQRGRIRSIEAVNDGGRWVWVASGEAQEFEDTQRYQAAHVRDRFTRELLEDYCEVVGVRPFEEEYYGLHAVLVEDTTPLPKTSKGYSYSELRNLRAESPERS